MITRRYSTAKLYRKDTIPAHVSLHVPFGRQIMFLTIKTRQGYFRHAYTVREIGLLGQYIATLAHYGTDGEPKAVQQVESVFQKFLTFVTRVNIQPFIWRKSKIIVQLVYLLNVCRVIFVQTIKLVRQIS